MRYVFIRDNPKRPLSRSTGTTRLGCRRFLVVERDNASSHEVYGVTDASEYAKEVVGDERATVFSSGGLVESQPAR